MMDSASETAASRGNPARSQAGTKDLLYRPLNFFLARAPLLPVQVYGELTDDSRRFALASEPLVRRALAVGSASLVDALERHKRCALAKRDADRMRAKLLRYEIRMSTRPTPFGLFAGVAVGQWGPATDLTIRSTCSRTRTRPDMAWLIDLVRSAEAIPAVRGRLRLLANPLAVFEAGRVVLSERTPGGKEGQPAPVSVRATAVVKQALRLSRTPIPHGDLVARLSETSPAATREKVEKLVTELWEQTFLLTDLRPPLTTDDPARYVAALLAGIPEAEDLLKRLDGLLTASAAWDRLDVPDSVELFESRLTQAGIISDRSQQPPVQVDMAMSIDGRINHIVAEEAARAAEILLRLSPFPLGSSAMAAYRQAFLNRYGKDRETPLLELFDPNRGLGPMSPHGYAPVGPGPAKAALRSRTLLQLACSALRDHKRTVILDDQTLGRLETWRPAAESVPVSLDLNFLLGARSASAIDEKEFTLVVGPNLGALAAGRNLARFSHMLAPDGPASLLDAAAAEEALAADHLWAEFVYLPIAQRMANVVIRPPVRSHEVVLGASPGVAPPNVIPLDELVVGVREGRFYVRWPAADKRVTFASGHMLSYHNAPAIGRFLMDLSYDGRALFSTFDWGPAESFPYLPRVQTGRIVLRSAQWRIQSDDLPLKSFEAYCLGLKNWRIQWDVPRHVCISVGDNRLLLDLDDEEQAKEIYTELQRLKDGESIIVQEVVPALNEAWLAGPSGNYYSEFVASLVLRAGGQPAAQPKTVRNAAEGGTPAGVLPEPVRATTGLQGDPVLWRKPPGSEWLFVKLYCPRHLENDVITDSMLVFAENAVASGLADSWFFIRYSDPEPHIRLRFHGAPERVTGHLFPHICEWAGRLMTNGQCLKFVFDTYEQEMERFGGPLGLAASETFFYADSRSAVELIRRVKTKQWSQDQTTLLAISVDDLLNGLGMNEAGRLRWYRSQATEGGPEAGADYRERKVVLRSLLGQRDEFLAGANGGPEIAAILATRRGLLAPIGQQLRELGKAAKLSESFDALCASYVHLHLNRVAGLDPAAEQRILSLLLRTSDSLQKAPLRQSSR
jgi:thiopeptide-type bacteriocin biosynthesis protein